jgi:hypothetical protein
VNRVVTNDTPSPAPCNQFITGNHRTLSLRKRHQHLHHAWLECFAFFATLQLKRSGNDLRCPEAKRRYVRKTDCGGDGAAFVRR